LDDCVIKPEELCSKYLSKKELWLLGEGLVYYKNKFEKQNLDKKRKHVILTKDDDSRIGKEALYKAKYALERASFFKKRQRRL
jgi:hypothetical protein